MREGLQTLSRGEEEVLRLLLVGHDAKSIAHTLDLSVHTVNERLRYARRKLGVSSSREAARILAETEQQDPNFSGVNNFLGTNKFSGNNFSGDKEIGVAPAARLKQPKQHSRQRDMNVPVIWLVGGVFLMGLIIAAFFLVTALGDDAEVEPEAEAEPAAVPAGVQPEVDLMPIADTNADGKVTAEEYRAFSVQGWDFVAPGLQEVKFAELDQSLQVAFVGITPNAQGIITYQMYVDAIPARFVMFDQNGDQVLNSDEINGRTFQPSP